MTKVKQKFRRRRAEILEAAIPFITDTSFEEISVSDICRDLGISVGTFYHYFQKKTDLLIGLLWLIDEDLEENIFPLLTYENELDNLRLFARGWAQHVENHGIERSRLISGINPEDEGFPEHERPAIHKLTEIITAGQEKGQITTESSPELLTELFLLTLRSVTMDWSRRDGSYPIVDKMNAYIDVFLRAFRP